MINPNLTSSQITGVDLMLLLQAVESGQEPLTIADARQPDCPLIYVNRAFELVTGYSRDEVIGKNCRFLQRDETDQPGLTKLRQALKNGEKCEVELRNYRKDGSLFINLLSISPIKNEEGEVTHFLGSQRDITARRQYEKELESLLEFAPEAIGVVNVETGLFVNVNRQAETIYRLSREQLMRTGPIDLSPLHQPNGMPSEELAVEYLNQAVEGKNPAFEWVHLTGDGQEIVCEVRLAGLGADRPNLVRFSVTDITARKFQAQDLETTRQQLANQVQRLVDVADMSAAVATISDPKELMQAITDLTQERFNLYHAHIYLYDAENELLHLSAGSGLVGRQMVAEKRSIPASAAQSLVARAYRTSQSVMVNDVRENEAFLAHPLLPETRAELATPMLVGDKAIGVLDVQAAEIDAFDEEDGVVLMTLASQMAIALDHATNLTQVEEARHALEESQEELQRALQELKALNQQMSQEGWREFLNTEDDAPSVFEFTGSPDLEKSLRTTARSLPQVNHLDFPLKVGDLPLGQLDFEGVLEEEEEAQILVKEVLERLGDHMENLRLSEQTRQALSESNTLYEISTNLNRSQSLEDILQAMVYSLKLFEISGVSFWDVELDREGTPVWQHLKTSWIADEAERGIPIGSRFKIKNFALNEFIFGQIPRMLLIGDVHSHALTAGDDNFQHLIALQPFLAAAYLPLTSGTRLIGMISVQWDKPRLFSDREVQFLETLSAQVAPAVESLNLLSEAQVRAELGGKLSNISAALSTAQTEDEMVQAIVDIMNFQDGQLSLSYILDAPLSRESRSEMVSLFVDGKNKFAGADSGPSVRLGDRATSELWLSSPSDPVFIDDIEAALDATDEIREEAAAEGWRSLAILPLFSSGRWQGILSISFENQHAFTVIERDVLIALVEPLGAVVASRRAQLAQIEAQKRAEFLYEISRQLNEASSDLDQIMQVIGRIYPTDSITRADLMLLTDETGRRIPRGRYAASWARDDTTRFAQPAVSAGLGHLLGVLGISRQREPAFVEDTHTLSELTSRDRSIFNRLKIRSLGILPLWVGEQQLGVILLQGSQPHSFAEAEKQLYAALTPQIAVAIQNQTLLTSAQERAEREQILREISEKVRRAPTVDMVLKTAASEVGRVFGRKALIYFNQAMTQTRPELTAGQGEPNGIENPSNETPAA